MYEDDEELYAEVDRRMARVRPKALLKTSDARQKPNAFYKAKKDPEVIKTASQSHMSRMSGASETSHGVKISKPGQTHVTAYEDPSRAISSALDENIDASINHFLNFPSAPKPVKHASDPLSKSKKRTLSELRENSLAEVTARVSSSDLATSYKRKISSDIEPPIGEINDGPTKKQKIDTSLTRSPSPMEDISMFPEEPPAPKPKKTVALTKAKSAPALRPIHRQPATHKLLSGKPTTSDHAQVLNEIEDISMFPPGDTPQKPRASLSSLPDSCVTTPSESSAKAPTKKPKVKPVASKPSVTLNIKRPVVRGTTNRPAKTSVKDYVRSVQGKPCGPFNFLKEKVISYVGGDGLYISQTTKNRVDMLIKHGATVQVDFDPDTATHVVVDADTGRSTVAKALGMSDIMQIPNHIPTVKWSWVSAGMQNPKVKQRAKQGPDADFEDLLPPLFDHARFSERFDAGDQKFLEERARCKAKAQRRASSSKIVETSVHDSEDEVSRDIDISDLSSLPPLVPAPPIPTLPLSPPQSPSLQTKKAQVQSTDPLGELIDQARDEVARGYETDDDDDKCPLPKKKKFTPRGWQCGVKPVSEYFESPNQYIIDKIIALRNIHDAKGGADNHFRVQAYTKIIPQLKALTKPIKCREDIQGLPHIAVRTIDKIMEIVETGNLRKLKNEQTEDVKCCMVFQGIYGVGYKTAMGWYRAGCRSLDDIRNRKGGIHLNSSQMIGLKFYDDINTRIPRDEVQAIFGHICLIAHKLDPKLSIDVMGSFRRGKADCGDIDILITRPTTDGKTHAGLMRPLLNALHSARILTEDLSLPSNINGLECTYRGLCRDPDDEDSLRRRIDILSVPWQNRGGALIYYTGDDVFNRAMRLKANKMGYSLNQRGLYAGVIRDPKNLSTKLHKGTLVTSETEERIFEILGIPWEEPHKRIRRDS